MAEAKPFLPVKLICGIIAGEDEVFEKAKNHLRRKYGPIDGESMFFPFDWTDYYSKQMEGYLKRKFLSFARLINPEKLSRIKLYTNRLEEVMRQEAAASRRVINLDPGYVSQTALIMATAKNFAHRIPLSHGIYAHLELLFKKTGATPLPWTYPDYKTEEYQAFFCEVRRNLLRQLRQEKNKV